MSITLALAQLISKAQYKNLPKDVINIAKMVILDGLSVTLAGSLEETSQIVANYIRKYHSSNHCSVFGFGFKTSPSMAAFVNGVSGHVLDFEAMWNPATHPTSPTLPGILALAEIIEATGQDIITALVYGFEVQARLRMATASVELGKNFHPPGIVGVMGSAVASSILLKLSTEQICMALGIAASRACGLFANVGTMTKSTHCGTAGCLGVEASLLAREGFTAEKNILQHSAGYKVFFEEYDEELITKDFGNPFRLVNPGIAIKKYPCHYGTQRAIQAALELRELYQINSKQISKIQIETPIIQYINRANPTTGLQGKFSLQYVVAAALVDGVVELGTFDDAKVRRQIIIDLMHKTEVIENPLIPPNFDGMWSTVQIILENDDFLEKQCKTPNGIWGKPLSRKEFLDKVNNCVVRILDKNAAKKFIALIENMEHASTSEIKELLAILRTPPS